jgi:hypothetical protein
MVRICPKPIPWHETFQRLTSYSQAHACHIDFLLQDNRDRLADTAPA